MESELQRGKKLGEGSQGIVYLVRDKISGDLFALKRNITDTISSSMLDEINILSSFNSDYLSDIKRFHGKLGLYTGKKYVDYLLSLMFGNLMSISDNLSFEEKRQSFFKICCGIYDLNSAGFVHADIKLENILYFRDSSDELTIKVSDFGLTEIADPRGTKKMIKYELYTPLYRPGELFLPPESRYFSIKSDVFAAGLLMIYLISPEQLNENDGEMTTIQRKIINGNLDSIGDIISTVGVPKVYAKSLNDLLRKMCASHDNRIKIYDVLKHEFFQGLVRNISFVRRPPDPGYTLTKGDLSEIRSFINESGNRKWLNVFLAVDLSRRVNRSLFKSEWSMLEYLNYCYKKIIMNKEISLNDVDFIHSVDGILYRRYLDTIVRTNEDIRFLTPLLYHPDYLSIDLTKLENMIPSVVQKLPRNIDFEAQLQDVL